MAITQYTPSQHLALFRFIALVLLTMFLIILLLLEAAAAEGDIMLEAAVLAAIALVGIVKPLAVEVQVKLV